MFVIFTAFTARDQGEVVETGGQAKLLIRSGAVRVNGVPETRRGRKLKQNDSVAVDEEEFVVRFEDESGE